MTISVGTLVSVIVIVFVSTVGSIATVSSLQTTSWGFIFRTIICEEALEWSNVSFDKSFGLEGLWDMILLNGPMPLGKRFGVHERTDMRVCLYWRPSQRVRVRGRAVRLFLSYTEHTPPLSAHFPFVSPSSSLLSELQGSPLPRTCHIISKKPVVHYNFIDGLKGGTPRGQCRWNGILFSARM